MEQQKLHRTSKMQGFHIQAVDGEIGHVDDFLVDEKTWTIRYLVVDTSNWIGGRSVLIAPAALERVDSADQTMRVEMTREQVKNSRSMESVELVLEENLPRIMII